MTQQIKPSVTNPTIAELYQNIQGGKLVLDPDFQRKFVWTTAHQEEFIDTIIRGYPFPEIYVCQGSIDLAKLKTTQHVIDGQQRLTTIKNYIDGKYDKPFSKIPMYADLDDDGRTDFLSYQVVLRDIGKVDDETIREIFRRINLTKFQLDDVEVHNAVYNGEFITAAKDVLKHVSLDEYGVFHESEFTRMADLHFMLLVMSTLDNKGYFPQDNEVENFIASYNEEYPNKEVKKKYLIETFQFISDLALPVDSIWFRKSNFFTLVVELNWGRVKAPKDVRKRLIDLEENILKNRGSTDTEFGKYYSYMYSATAGRKARATRASVFRKYVLPEAPQIS
ncbi:DUF262 domain-containing protein [Pseudoxanthomonas sp. NC8]|nr:DUF262 domain-containing protein [Pseudoxanthomonas sp. NC8]